MKNAKINLHEHLFTAITNQDQNRLRVVINLIQADIANHGQVIQQRQAATNHTPLEAALVSKPVSLNIIKMLLAIPTIDASDPSLLTLLSQAGLASADIHQIHGLMGQRGMTAHLSPAVLAKAASAVFTDIRLDGSKPSAQIAQARETTEEGYEFISWKEEAPSKTLAASSGSQGILATLGSISDKAIGTLNRWIETTTPSPKI